MKVRIEFIKVIYFTIKNNGFNIYSSDKLQIYYLYT